MQYLLKSTVFRYLPRTFYGTSTIITYLLFREAKSREREKRESKREREKKEEERE